MLKIAVDTMGGDLGSKEVVKAILAFLEENPDAKIYAFGKKEELSDLEGKCEIIDAPDVVPMEAGALEVLRMRNSSMCKAIKAVKDDGLDGVISAGSTGGFLSSSTITLKLIPGVKRAAITTSFPTAVKGKYAVILDIGANNENSAEELVQFAKMGKIYYENLYDKNEPAVHLISNGSESEKGSETVKQAHKMLKEMNFPGFEGNVEARYVLDGAHDVVVCDGFTGNIFLKATEGVAKMMSKMFSNAFKKNLWTKLGYLHVSKGIKDIKETMDYKKVGGGIILGINGVVVKAHGNSDAGAFKCALDVLKKMVNLQIVNKIKAGFEDA